jgi:hypothetical protein
MSDPEVQKKAFGLKEIVLTDITGETVVTLPAALKLGFEEDVITAQFPGNDEIQGVMTQPQGVKGTFEQGGYPLEAVAIMTGHTIDKTGVTPDQIATLNADSSAYPYFVIYGKSLADEGDDLHIKIKKAKLTKGINGTFERGKFFTMDTEFYGVRVDGSAYEVVGNETAQDLEAFS